MIIIAVAVSGSLLVFRTEIRQVTSASQSTWDGKEDIGWQRARDLAIAHHSDADLQILWFPNELRPYYEAAYRRGSEQFIDYIRIEPATGVISPSPEDDWLAWMEGFHINLHLGELGAWLVSWSVVILVIILITGLILWWPGWRRHLWFAIRNRGKLLLFDLHRVFGVLTTPVILLMSITGLVWSFPNIASKAVHFTTLDWHVAESALPPSEAKSRVPRQVRRPISDAKLLDKAKAWAPDEAFVFYITYPTEPDENRQVRMQLGFNPAPFGKVYRIYFDQYSGEILGTESPDGSLADQFLNHWNDILHFGTFGGWPTMIIWTIIPLFIPFFAISGLVLWRRRVGRKHSLSRAQTENGSEGLAMEPKINRTASCPD